jgi:hypothetical protein
MEKRKCSSPASVNAEPQSIAINRNMGCLAAIFITCTAGEPRRLTVANRALQLSGAIRLISLKESPK